MRVANTDKRLLDWMLALFPGGGVYQSAGTSLHKGTYHAYWNRTRAVALLAAVRDYLVIKRERAQMLLDLSAFEYRETDRRRIIAMREEVHDKLLYANRRGPDAKNRN